MILTPYLEYNIVQEIGKTQSLKWVNDLTMFLEKRNSDHYMMNDK